MISFALRKSSKQPSKTILPYEIWFHIASFIPSNDLPRLMHIHRAFFNLVMESVYREVLIYHEGVESTSRCLKAMGPVAASYVRKLVLRPHLFGLYMPSKAGPPFDHISTWWKKTTTKVGRADAVGQGSVKPQNARTLIRKIRGMTQLTSVVVRCYFADSVQYFLEAMPFMEAAWLHSPRLQDLVLEVPIECLDNVLATMPHFPVLSKLTLSTWSHPNPHGCMTELESAATFINRHSSSLTHLTINTLTSNFDLSPLFSGIEQLPKLIGAAAELSLQRLDPEEGNSVTDFLTKHRIALQELRLQFYESAVTNIRATPSSFFANSIFQVDFPSISSLDLGLCNWDKEFEISLASSMARYIFKFRHTLTRLTIRDCELSLPVIEAFVSALSGDTVLQELEMLVHYLSNDLLGLLAQKLPQLRSLDVTYSWLIYKDDGLWNADLRNLTSSSPSREFLEKTRENDYSSWSLRHLRVCPRELYAAQCGDVRKVMAASLPNLHTINGIPRSHFDDSHLMLITPLYFPPLKYN